METGTVAAFQIGDGTGVSEARRGATAWASNAGFSDADTGKLAIIVTELATNIVKHAGHGSLIVNRLAPCAGHAGVAILALDKGPGMTDVAASLRDGYSTAGSPGTGLGAVRRLATAFDVCSSAGKGTAILASLRPGHQPRDFEAGPIDMDGLVVAKSGEQVSGDKWAVRQDQNRAGILLADGLGHGEHAAQASRLAVSVFEAHPELGPGAALEAVHRALRATRGAAVAIAEIDLARREVRFAGLGNISGIIISMSREHNMVSHNGTVGHEARRIQEFAYAWPEGAVMVLHSDGISKRWRLEEYPGLSTRPPLLIAGVLYRDYGREHDDSGVVVVKDVPAGGVR